LLIIQRSVWQFFIKTENKKLTHKNMQTNKKIALIFAALGLILGGAGTIALQTHAQNGQTQNPTTTVPVVQTNEDANTANKPNVVATGNVEKKGIAENDKETNDNAADQAVLATAKITSDQAKFTAMKSIDANAGTFSDVRLENENGKAVYKVKFQNNGAETEVQIDAVTGNVLKTESEQDEKQGAKTGNAENGENGQPSQETDQANQ
jgi:uncharacterized membrane protein YkoI